MIEDKNPEHSVKGLWTPNEVFFNPKLSYFEKFLFSIIQLLDGPQHCFCTNFYLAELLDVTEKTISTSISNLIELNYVKQLSFDGRRRIIKINLDYTKVYGEYRNFFRCKHEKIVKQKNKSDEHKKNIFSKEKIIRNFSKEASYATQDSSSEESSSKDSFENNSMEQSFMQASPAKASSRLSSSSNETEQYNNSVGHDSDAEHVKELNPNEVNIRSRSRSNTTSYNSFASHESSARMSVENNFALDEYNTSHSHSPVSCEADSSASVSTERGHSGLLSKVTGSATTGSAELGKCDESFKERYRKADKSLLKPKQKKLLAVKKIYQRIPDNVKNIAQAVFEYWNSKEGLPKHKEDTLNYFNTIHLLSLLIQGTFTGFSNGTSQYAKHQFKRGDFIDAINQFQLAATNPEYEYSARDNNKSYMKKMSLLNFLWNDNTNVDKFKSWFLTFYERDAILLSEKGIEDKDPNLTNLIMIEFYRILGQSNFDTSDRSRAPFVKAANKLNEFIVTNYDHIQYNGTAQQWAEWLVAAVNGRTHHPATYLYSKLTFTNMLPLYLQNQGIMDNVSVATYTPEYRTVPYTYEEKQFDPTNYDSGDNDFHDFIYDE